MSAPAPVAYDHLCTARSTVDEEIERIGLGWFHYVAAGICGLGNASDAVELLSIGCVSRSAKHNSMCVSAL